MVKFVAKNILGLGLTMGNLIKLQQGRPIKISLAELGSPDIKDIIIFYGTDERVIKEQLKEFIGPETKVHIDPRLKDH